MASLLARLNSVARRVNREAGYSGYAAAVVRAEGRVTLRVSNDDGKRWLVHQFIASYDLDTGRHLEITKEGSAIDVFPFLADLADEPT
jgi:hypothetical protein